MRVVQGVLCVGHASVWYRFKDAADAEVLRWSWCEQYTSVRTEAFPLVSNELVAVAQSVGAGTSDAGCTLFLSDLLSGVQSCLRVLLKIFIRRVKGCDGLFGALKVVEILVRKLKEL